MKPGSLELVEKVMLIEEIFGAEIPDEYMGTIDGPSEIADRFEPWLSNKRA
jgi:acyl carrier protein